MTSCSSWLLLFSMFACCFSAGRCSNILILSPLGTKSHINLYGEIASILLDRGHKITLVSTHAIKDHINLTQIRVDLPMEKFVKNTFSLGNPAIASHVFTSVVPTACSDALQAYDIQRLDVEEFDLVMTGYFVTECFLSLVFKKEVPIILTMANNLQGALHESIGNIDFPSFVPSIDSEVFHPMGFRDRLKNMMYDVGSRMWTNFMARYSNLKECKRRGFCSPEMTSYTDVEKNASLLFINNVRALDEPARPYMPGVINVGGLNCRPAKPLPQDLEDWIQDSGENGFIYISLGSAATPTDMPAEYAKNRLSNTFKLYFTISGTAIWKKKIQQLSRRILVEVFKSLPYRVLWKWNEDTIEGLSSNVKLAKWLPQQDILGHPKLKLFISHGGLFSTLEAIYHGVPVLGMPIFLDQFTNVNKIVTAGWGEKAHWAELEFDALRNKILSLIIDKRYSTEVQRRSWLMRDQLVSPREEVAYWTEYVIRHKGAPHMSSPVHDMYWYEVYNVDVWLFIGSVCTGTIALFVLLCGALLRCCYRRVRGKTPNQSKKKRH